MICAWDGFSAIKMCHLWKRLDHEIHLQTIRIHELFALIRMHNSISWIGQRPFRGATMSATAAEDDLAGGDTLNNGTLEALGKSNVNNKSKRREEVPSFSVDVCEVKERKKKKKKKKKKRTQCSSSCPLWPLIVFLL
jgi:hypothetical protein